MTEDEAREKWCPMVRTFTIDDTFGTAIGTNVNRFPAGQPMPAQIRCIASECMMWRWDDQFKYDSAGMLIPNADPPVSGHCGLAR